MKRAPCRTEPAEGPFRIDVFSIAETKEKSRVIHSQKFLFIYYFSSHYGKRKNKNMSVL